MKRDVHKRTPLIVTFLIMIVITLPTHVLATNWTVYKNSPQHTGVASDALEPPLGLFWKFETEGPIVSSPAVYDGVLYFGSGDYYIYALDSLTGELKWKFKTNGRVDASPAVWEDTVYVGSLDGKLYALDAKTGQLKWKSETSGQIISSPVVDYGLVFFGSTDGFIYALNATTGEKKWAFKTDGKIEASPAVYGQLLIAGSYDGKVYALGARSGAIVWTFDAREPITSGSVVVDSGTVYVIAGAKYLYALDATSGEINWKKEIAIRDTGYTKPPMEITQYKKYEGKFSPSVLSGMAYVLYYHNVYKVSNWGLTSWREDHYYFQAIDVQNGQTKWNFEVGGPIQNAPTVSGGTVYFGCDDGYIYGVHADSGELKWKYFINSSIRSSPVVANGMLYVGADDGYLYAFASDEVIETYSSLNSLKGLLTKLKGEGIDIPDTIPTTIISAEHHLKFGELNQARNEISTAEGLVSEIMYNYTKQQLDSIKKEYTTLESKGFNVTDTKQLILQAEDELDKGNYDKAIELTEQAKEELQNIKSSEAERARSMLDEVELEIAKVKFIANVSKLEQDLILVKEKITNEDYPSAIALLAGIKQRINLIQEANNAILTAKTTIDQEKERGLDERSAEVLLERAIVLFEKGDYENAKKIAEQASEIAVDIDQDGIPNEEDIFPDINNTYLYVAIVMLILSVGTGVVTLRKRHRTKKTSAKNRNAHRTLFMEFPEELLTRYESVEFLGEGGFARVFKVKRKKDGEIVALKIPRIDEKTSKTFIKEVSTWLHLDHPNIVKLHDVDILPVPYLEMEFVEGVNVDGKTVRDLGGYPKPVDEKTALKLIRGIAEGLKHAHSKGIYHRDLKPLNILLKADLTPKITDWGLAKLGTMSSSRSVLGYTPLYASPEHLMPSKYGHTDGRTDIWQLGVTFYELLTGKLPFEGYTYEEVFGKIVDEGYRFTPPSKINPELAKYDGIFKKLLAKRKEERYQSVEEFLRDLERLREVERRKAELEMEVEELKKSLAKSAQALKQSKSAEEALKNRRLIVEVLSRLTLAYAELNNKAELLNTLNDLKFYTIQNLTDLTNAINTVEMLVREGLPVSEELIERLKVLVHNIKRENGV